MRLIDADALEKEIYKWMPKDMETWADSSIPPIEDLVVSIMMTIEEQPTVNEWIPCSERLPKKGEFVLVTLHDDLLSEWERRDVTYVEIASYDERTDYYDGLHFFGSEWEKLDTVVAWMPLPKPYGLKK